ncbi:MAG: hypothetical protein IJD96_01795 [Lachnospiraceae bacterium]|nr:hypothetical protein [Lachnospiraceae bacterium]
MTEKNHGRGIAFVETYDEGIKSTIEKAFLNHGVSYLIKVDKVRDVKKGLFESKKKFSFYINRYQQDEARAAMQGKSMDEDKIMYLI